MLYVESPNVVLVDLLRITFVWTMFIALFDVVIPSIFSLFGFSGISCVPSRNSVTELSVDVWEF